MNKEKLSKQHAELKEQLAELVDFINSEEYYGLSDSKKQLIATQLVGMEITINAMSVRLWGNQTTPSSWSPLMMSMLGMLMTPSSFGTPSAPSTPIDLPEEENKGE